jgi:four helix bundle protein
MRDHRKLDVFVLADRLAILIYEVTRRFPEDERYGLSSQLRRAAVSVGANIVEGSARESFAEYVRYLSIAYSSAREVDYELSIAARLGYLKAQAANDLLDLSSRTCGALHRMLKTLTGQV